MPRQCIVQFAGGHSHAIDLKEGRDEDEVRENFAKNMTEPNAITVYCGITFRPWYIVSLYFRDKPTEPSYQDRVVELIEEQVRLQKGDDGESWKG